MGESSGTYRQVLDDGIYALDYSADVSGERFSDSALATLVGGRILGSDRWGGVFEGSYECGTGEAIGRVHVQMRVPADGVLVTGFAAGGEDTSLDITGYLTIRDAEPVAVVEVSGVPLSVRLKYLGPLPQ